MSLLTLSSLVMDLISFEVSSNDLPSVTPSGCIISVETVEGVEGGVIGGGTGFGSTRPFFSDFFKIYSQKKEKKKVDKMKKITIKKLK